MKAGDLVRVNPDTTFVFLTKEYEGVTEEFLTIVEVVEKDVDVPEHVIVLTSCGLKKFYKEDVELVSSVHAQEQSI